MLTSLNCQGLGSWEVEKTRDSAPVVVAVLNASEYLIAKGELLKR